MKTEIILTGTDINKANWEIFQKGLRQYVEEAANMVLTPYEVKFEEQLVEALNHSDCTNPLQLYVQAITDLEEEEFYIMFDPAVLEFALYEILHYSSHELEEDFKDVLLLFKTNFESNHNSSWIHHSYKTFPGVGIYRYYISNGIDLEEGWIYRSTKQVDDLIELENETIPEEKQWVRQNQVTEVSFEEYQRLLDEINN